MITRVLLGCDWCGRALPVGARTNRRFCGEECSRAYAKKQWREKNPKSALGVLATGTKAEVNEMRVALDLLERGYEVYRAAFQGMPCDMLVNKPHDNTDEWRGLAPLRIEVTTGNISSSGTLSHPQRDTSKYDVLAVVVGDKIVYKPELT